MAEYNIPLTIGIFIVGIIIGIIFQYSSEKKAKNRHKKTENDHKEMKNEMNQGFSGIYARLDNHDEIIRVNEGIIQNLEILGKKAKEGSRLVLINESSAVDITLQVSDTLELERGDFTFTHSGDLIQLERIDNKWKELVRTNNS